MKGNVNCPCCGYPTLTKRLDNEICYLCWWEDDLLPDGPNYNYTLTEASDNFKKYLIMYRPSDHKYNKLRNKKIDAIKREIISTFDSKKKSIDEKRSEIKKLEKLLEKELDLHLKKYYQEKLNKKSN
jgi:hypothetical protein